MTKVASRRVATERPLARLVEVVAIILGAATFAAPASAGPSFPCSGQLSQTETVICSDAELSDLDSAMALAYQRALATVAPGQAEGIRGAQQEWVAYRNKCGFEKDCIRSATLDELQALNAVAQIATGKRR